MTREEAIEFGKTILLVADSNDDDSAIEFTRIAISALEQEPCQLLIIKSDILLHQDDRKKWMDSIKREKENGVIILPPYFTPLLVPNDIEIRIEQPCDNAISRETIEDIKADIEAARYGLINDGLDVALRIIDKHIEGR